MKTKCGTGRSSRRLIGALFIMFTGIPPVQAAYEEISVETAPGVIISGTLTLPETNVPAPYPIVILIGGSGEQNRDVSNVFPGYSPHKDWAQSLANDGVATFRYDERGVGQSSGNWGQMTIQQHAEDVRVFVQVLGSREDINPEKVFLFGHSEGSMIASLVASDANDIAGVVHLAGPGWALPKIIEYQSRSMTPRGELNDAQYEQAVKEAQHKFVSYVQKIPNLSSSLEMDPTELIGKTKSPILIVQGAKDVQIMPEQALNLAQGALQAGNMDVTIKLFPKLNHLLVPAAQTPGDYQSLTDLTVSSSLMSFVADWVLTVAQSND